MPRLMLGLLVAAAAAGCAESSATAPGALSSPALVGAGPSVPPPAAAGPFEAGTITFDGVASGPIASYAERGLVVTLTGADWTGMMTYGNRAPFVQFRSEAGASTTGTAEFHGGGQLFSFVSVDLYSSTTRIPYTIVGLRGGAAVFTLTDTLPNTFGNFRTVGASDPGLQVDTLRITLTNSAAPCCANPMGLDNVVVR